MNLQEFTDSFLNELHDELNTYYGNAEEVFVDLMCKYLEENGVVENVQPSFWQKTGHGIKINAYSLDEEGKKLTLFIALCEMPFNKVKTVGRSEIERITRKAVKFFEYCRAGKIKSYIDESSTEAYDLADIIESNNKELEQLDFILLTNCVYKANEVVNVDVPGIPDVGVNIWDIERLYQAVSEMHSEDAFVIQFKEDFGETLEMMKVPTKEEINSDFEVYVGYVPGTVLAQAYDKYGQRLIERNVRSFLQAKGGVNKGIKDTLEKEKGKFIAYNNGISTTAESGELKQSAKGSNLFEIKSLAGWQIVNGGQTTASLHHAWESGIDISGVYVQAKLTLLRTTEESKVNLIISNISKYANTQNKISFSDLGANDSLHIQLEQLSRNIWTPSYNGLKSNKKWYYERARGQYTVDLNRQKTRSAKDKFKMQHPKHMVISKTQLAKYYMAWNQAPYVVSKGNEANFTEFSQLMKRNKTQIDADFYKQAIAKAIIFTTVDDIVKKLDLPGYKANVVAYTVSMLSKAIGETFPLEEVWRNQSVSKKMKDIITKMAKMTWDYISNPSTPGTNISQWCKKTTCWDEFVDRYLPQAQKFVKGLHKTVVGTDLTAAEATLAYQTEGRKKPDIIQLVKEASLEYIDQRPKNGRLWVIHTNQCYDLMRELAENGYAFVYSSKGSKATKNRAAWFLK